MNVEKIKEHNHMQYIHREEPDIRKYRLYIMS